MYGESPATSSDVPPPPEQHSLLENAPSQSNQFDYYVSGLPSWKQKLILAKLQRDAAAATAGGGDAGVVLDDDDLHTGASATSSEGARLMSGADPVSRAAEHVGAEAEKNGPPPNNRAADLGLPRVSGKPRATAGPPPPPSSPSAAAGASASRHWPVPGSDRRQLSHTGSRPTWYRPPDEIVVVENAAASRGVGWELSENGPAFAAFLSGSSCDGCQAQPRIGIVHQVVSLIEQQQQHQQQQLMEATAAAAAPKPPPRRKPRQLADGPFADSRAFGSSPPLSPDAPEQSHNPVAAASVVARPATSAAAALQLPAAARLGPTPFHAPKRDVYAAPPAAAGVNGVYTAAFVVPASAAAPPLPPRRTPEDRVSAAASFAAGAPPTLTQQQNRSAPNGNAEVHRARHVDAADAEQKPLTAGVLRVVVGGVPPRSVAAADGPAASAAADKTHPTVATVQYAGARSFPGGPVLGVSTAANGPIAAVNHTQQQPRILSAGAAVGSSSSREERLSEQRQAAAGGKTFGAVAAARDETNSAVRQRMSVPASSSIAVAAELSVVDLPTLPSDVSRKVTAATPAFTAGAIADAAVAPSGVAATVGQRQGDLRPTAPSSSATTAGPYGPATPVAASAAVVKRDLASGAASASDRPLATAVASAQEASAATAAASATSVSASSTVATSAAAPRLTLPVAASASTTSESASAVTTSSVASFSSALPRAGAAATAGAVEPQQPAPRATVSTVALPSASAARQSAAGGIPAAPAATAAPSRSSNAAAATAASSQPSARTASASANTTAAVVNLPSATTTSSSTDPPAVATTVGTAGTSKASGASNSGTAPGNRAQPDNRAASAAAPSSGSGSDKSGEALEFLQALSRRKAAAAAAAAAAAEADGDRHPEMGTGRRVFDTRSAMSKERKVPEYEKIFEGKAVMFYNDNVVVGRGNLRKSSGTAKAVKFNSSLLSRIFEYPSEDSLLASLPKDSSSSYYDDPAGARSTPVATPAGGSCGDEEEEPPLPTRFGALALDPNVILEGRPRGSSGHSPHQLPAVAADASGGTVVGLSGSAHEPSNTDC